MRHSSLAVRLGEGPESLCPQGLAATAAGGHQVLHSRAEAWPRASIITTEKVAARNTHCATRSGGKVHASRETGIPAGIPALCGHPPVPTRRDLRDFTIG